jgi:hypothetical protein
MADITRLKVVLNGTFPQHDIEPPRDAESQIFAGRVLAKSLCLMKLSAKPFLSSPDGASLCKALAIERDAARAKHKAINHILIQLSGFRVGRLPFQGYAARSHFRQAVTKTLLYFAVENGQIWGFIRTQLGNRCVETL